MLRRDNLPPFIHAGSDDDAMHPLSPQPPFTTEPRQFTMKLDINPGAAAGIPRTLSSSPSSTHSSPRSGSLSVSPARSERLRPPPISLAGTGLYDQAPMPLPHDVPAFAFDPQSPSSMRRASLPVNMLYSTRLGAFQRELPVYSSPRAIDVVESTPRYVLFSHAPLYRRLTRSF